MLITLHNNYKNQTQNTNFPWSHSFQIMKSPSFDGSLYTVIWNSDILKKFLT